MCVAAEDCMIFIYDASNIYKDFKKIKGITSPITKIDCSINYKFIQCNNTSKELLYFDLTNLKRVNVETIPVHSEKWDSYSCPFGWASQGVWPMNSDNYKVAAVDRSVDGSILAI